ncbi:MAG: hypothetical protein LQ346_008470 [Caloplaca aetnensis]|nr:MAG: hypothetical protein LQ346_008470 [Caloplaca aetnensis]
MPDTDNIELGQAPPEKKVDVKHVDTSDPESFYRSNSSKEQEVPSKEPLREEALKKPVIPPRTQKPRIRRSTDDMDSKNTDTETRSLKKDCEEARHELRIAWRDNREQAIELRDLKKQNAHLKETMRTQGDSRSYKDHIMSERRRFFEHVDMLEDHIGHLKHQLEKTKLHMDQLTFQTREANEEKAVYETKLQSLQKQNNRLNDDLTECRDDILRLQPPSQIPDSKIAEEFNNLYQQIASWVDDEAEDSLSMEARLGSLLTDKDAPELLKSILDNDLIRATRKYPDAEPLILRYIIQIHIHRCILADELYLFGLDEHNETILRSIAHAMEALEPKRDFLTIQRWRSETLQALYKIDGFQTEQARLATTVSQDLFTALTYLLPEIASEAESGWKRLHDTITMPAVHLATNMRFSTSVYRIITRLPRISSPSSVSSSSSAQQQQQQHENHIIYHPDIQRYTIIDIATQKVLRPDSVLKVADDGRIGEHVMVVQPLLLRMQKDSAAGVALAKPAVAVRLDEPMAKRSKGVGKMAGWASSWFGGEPPEGART